MWAAGRGHIDVLRELVKAGAKMDLQDIVRMYIDVW